MGKYKITAPDGNSYQITAPDNASQDDVLSYAKNNYGNVNPPQMAAQETPASLGSRIWDAMAVPEQKSRQGLEMLSEGLKPTPEVTGSLPRDLLMNYPSLSANILSKVAPGFISRGSLATAGAAQGLKLAAPLTGLIGKGIASGAESLSGAKPGILTEAFKDPSLIFARIPGLAKAAYAAENEGIQASKLVAQNPHPLGMVMKAKQMAEEGTLTAGEALAARKNVDQLWRSRAITEDFKHVARKIFDDVVKAKDSLLEADQGFARGKKAADLRQIFPQNKYGGASPFKMMMGALAAKAGPLGKTAAFLLSPMASGMAATGLGAASRLAGPVITNPIASVTAGQILEALRQKQAEEN